MDSKGSESEQEESLFKKYCFESEYSYYHQEIDEFFSDNNSNNSLFLNKKIKPENNEITYDLGKTKDTKNDIVICNEINFEIIFEIKVKKIDEGTQTRRPYYYDE
jgi:hypothetical protein